MGNSSISGNSRVQQASPRFSGREEEVLIRMEGVFKGFEYNNSPIEILKDARLTINRGESVAIVGESGIGKSTLLHILGALDPPDAGHVYFTGRDVFGMNIHNIAAFRNESIGFVFQFHYLLAEFTALENVMIPGFIRGLTHRDIRPAAEAILVRVGLENRLSHRVTDLSGGEQQRVALARALVMKPEILLADEPTGNLDTKNSAQIHDFLIQLNRDTGMTMVVVTHNTKLAVRMQRRMTIQEGKLAEIE